MDIIEWRPAEDSTASYSGAGPSDLGDRAIGEASAPHPCSDSYQIHLCQQETLFE